MPDARRPKPVVPVHPCRALARLAEPRADERAEERAQVDPHVEDRKPGVAPGALLGIEVADDGADVRLEETGAEDDQQQPGVEGRRSRESRGCSGRGRSARRRRGRRAAVRSADRQSIRPAARARTRRTCRARTRRRPWSASYPRPPAAGAAVMKRMRSARMP